VRECKGSWVEVALLVIVVLGQWRGWRWIWGLLISGFEGIVAQGVKAEEAKKLKAMVGMSNRGLSRERQRRLWLLVAIWRRRLFWWMLRRTMLRRLEGADWNQKPAPTQRIRLEAIKGVKGKH